MIFGTDGKEEVMETVELKKEINWQKVFGVSPKIKNLKGIFYYGLENEDSRTRIVKIKIGDQEYILNHYISHKSEEITIKSNRSILLLEVTYDKETNDVKKKVNYDFTEVIVYFLVNFFYKRLENNEKFQGIKECLKEYEEISLEISENSI